MTDLLDHGYVEKVETWGSEERIVESARMSTDGAFRGWGPTKACAICGKAIPSEEHACACSPLHNLIVEGIPGDEKLLAYLYYHGHLTPFEMAGATFEVQAPIFVFRQWHRHRTFSYNELSARYTEMPDLFYVPETFKAQGQISKQLGQGTCADQEKISNLYKLAIRSSRLAYDSLISMGLSREQARGVLPVAQYSRMRVSGNLRNWLSFLSLRTDPHAQEEIRVYADVIRDELAKTFPRTLRMWEEKNRGL